jgi:tRNA threonylcarbamoyladenosine biosynthesis protein TsaB
MKLVAIETSTEVMSVAVAVEGRCLEQSAAGGAQSSARLLALIGELLAEAGLSYAALDAVVWGRGPGSFTGVRTACAVAQGLGFAHDIPLLGVDTLACCAQQALRQGGLSPEGSRRVVVAMDARMGEIYVARYAALQWQGPDGGAFELLSPAALQLDGADTLCGNAARAHPQLADGAAACVDCLPTAGAMLELAPGLLAAGLGVPAENALPLYVRDKVALTTAERQAVQSAG